MFNVQITHISDAVLHDGQAQSVRFPGVVGEFEIATDHAPMVALLAWGEIIIKVQEDDMRVVTIGQGLMRFDGKTLYAIVE